MQEQRVHFALVTHAANQPTAGRAHVQEHAQGKEAEPHLTS